MFGHSIIFLCHNGFKNIKKIILFRVLVIDNQNIIESYWTKTGYKSKKIVNWCVCYFHHPQNMCRKWMKNCSNNGGCKKEKYCDLKHVKICQNSLKHIQCKHIGVNKICYKRYHLKGTKASNNDGERNNKNKKNNYKNGNRGGNQNNKMMVETTDSFNLFRGTHPETFIKSRGKIN